MSNNLNCQMIHDKREYLFQTHEKMCQGALLLMKTKNEDYSARGVFDNFNASKVLDVDPVTSVLIRMMDKIGRIQSFILNDTLNHESVEDSCIDIINYAVIAYVMLMTSSRGSSVISEVSPVCDDKSSSNLVFVVCQDYSRFVQLTREVLCDPDKEYYFATSPEVILGRLRSELYLDSDTMRKNVRWEEFSVHLSSFTL